MKNKYVLRGAMHVLLLFGFAALFMFAVHSTASIVVAQGGMLDDVPEAVAVTEAPMAEALRTGARLMKGTWRPSAGEQQEVYNALLASDGAAYDSNELRSMASPDVAVVNAFLRREGFNIQLQPSSGDALNIASILKIDSSWKFGGRATEIRDQRGTPYPAIEITKGIRFLKTPGGTDIADMVIEIATAREGEFLYIVPSGRVRGSAMAARQMNTVTTEYTGVRFPMVDLDVREDVSSLIGMPIFDATGKRTIGRIGQALQQTKLALDERGARVESAAAVAVSRGIQIETIFTINNNFGVCILRNRPENKVEHVITALLPRSVWKRPQR